MRAPPAGFVLLGSAGDETRLLLDRGHGFSLPIPGHPILATTLPPGPPAYHAVVTMTDLAVELGVRIDALPPGNDPATLAAALTEAYATTRAQQLRRIGALRGRLLGVGFDAGANTIYVLRDAGPAPRMEHVQVLVHQTPTTTWAVYLTARYATADVDVLRWAHLRAALAGQQHWDAVQPRAVAPALWPGASAFAEPSARLRLTPEAHAEALAKSAALGPLTAEQARELVDVLITLATNDDPPTKELPPQLVELLLRQVTARGPTRACETLLRNTPAVRTAHDLRAWCWQGIWAIGHRPDQPSSTAN